jgi:peptide deformylase
MILKLYPNEILLEPTKAVEEFDNSLKDTAKKMQDFMKRTGGVGLAANQVGLSKSMFVTADKVFVNPEILEYNGEVESKEGCLSFPTIQVAVKRAKDIVISYLTEDGEKKLETLTGEEAIIAQHEYDHLQGKTFLDYVSPMRKDIILRKFKKWKKRFTNAQMRQLQLRKLSDKQQKESHSKQ